MDDFRLTRSNHDNPGVDERIDEPRTILAWAQGRLGGGRLSLAAVVRGLPRRGGLRWDRVADSPLGGRLARHLRYLDDEEARALEARGQAFLDKTEITDEDLSDLEPPPDEVTQLESALDPR